MKYGIIQPPKDFAEYIRFFWFVEGNQPYVHHAFAYPCPELIFCYQGHFKYRIGNGTDVKLSSGIFGQTDTLSQVTLNGQDIGILGVYLYPQVFPQLFGLPASALTSQHADFKSILGRDGEILEEQMTLAKDNSGRVNIFARFLRGKLQNIRTEYKVISSSITSIINAYQSNTISQLADNNYLSLRQFQRRFLELSGFSPKLFLRIARFNSVLNKSHQAKSLSEIGVECGYYDQSHFIHDFQKFSGLRPKEYFKEETVPASGRGTVEF